MSASAASPSLARAHFDAGSASFHAGKYHAAVVELTASLEAKPVAEFARDTRHLLGRAQVEVGDWGGAVATLQGAIDAAVGPGKTVLVDLLRFNLGRAYRGLERFDAAARQFHRVAQDAMSPLRAEAGMLEAQSLDLAGDASRALSAYKGFLTRWPDHPNGRDIRLRVASIELSQGEVRRAIAGFKKIWRSAALSSAGKLALRELKLLAAKGHVFARTDTPGERLLRLEWLIGERRFSEALAPALAYLKSSGKLSQRAEKIQALQFLAKIYEQTREEVKALEMYARLQRLTGLSPRVVKKARLMALGGDYAGGEHLILRRFRGKRTKLYWRKIADFRYDFGKYEGAYEAYVKSMSKAWHRAKRKGIRRLRPRMAWCLLAMGRSSEVVSYFRRKRGKSLRDRMSNRYWLGRALQLSGRTDDAREVLAKLADSYPQKYYGILAHSRLVELRGEPIAKNAGAPNATVLWTEDTLRPAYGEAPLPASVSKRLRAVSSLAAAWGSLAPEANRALELAGLGFDKDALVEIRVIDMDIRTGRRGLQGLVGRARADLLDNRREKRGRAGARIRDGGRRNRAQARRFMRHASQIRRAVRQVQVAYGDYYGIRREAYEKRTLRAESPSDDSLALWKQAYPIAYPKMVGVFSDHHDVPGYFLYSIMSVESTFHPHPVSVANAYGLLQVIPRTGRRLASELGIRDFSPEMLLKPEMSVYFGSYYLGQLLEKFHGQELLAAAAYNAGPHRIERWLRANPTSPMDLFVENIPYRESRGYARSVLERIASYRRVYHAEGRIYASNSLKPQCLAQPNY